MLSAFHSAIRGGLMISRNILDYLSQMNIIHTKHEDTMLDEALGYGVAVLGFLFQVPVRDIPGMFPRLSCCHTRYDDGNYECTSNNRA